MKPTHPRARWAIDIVRGVNSFEDLENRIASLPNPWDRGAAFEVFVEAFLATQPIAQAEAIWAGSAVPLEIREQLNLPPSDKGEDGVYRDRNGNLIVYQAKFRTGRASLTWKELSTFFGIAEQADQRVLLTNSDAIARVAEQRSNFHCFRGIDFERLDGSDFERIVDWLTSGATKPVKREPRCYQGDALRDIANGLAENDRASVVMACGTGKTLIALWAAEQANPSRVLVLVPSLALLRATLHEWTRFSHWGEKLQFLCVCSDPTVRQDVDEIAVNPEDTDFPVSTDPRDVERFLKHRSDGVKVVFSTYQSASVVAIGAKGLGQFDIGIFDEAHRTAGREGSKLAFALSDENIPIRKRLFFTATPRHYNIRQRDKEGDAKLVFSMDNEDVYGPVVHRLSFAEAAKRDIICNYKVVISVVDGKMVTNDLLRRGEVLVKDDYARARQVAVQLALQRAVDEFGVGRIITFHTKVDAAKEFVTEGATGVQNHLPAFSTYHVNGTQRTSDREGFLKAFAKATKGLITNARCLNEGVDVPAVDMVAFVAPRRSKIDIVQATGRAMRKAGAEKKFGYVLLPIFLEQEAGETLEAALERSQFDEVAAVLNAMQEQDDDLAETIRALKQEKGRTGGFDESRLADKIVTLGPEIGLADLQRAVSAMILENLGVSWDESYGRLVSYKMVHGDCRVTRNFQTADGYRLGEWVHKQRIDRDKMPLERRAKLDELGFEWDPLEEAWTTGYGNLKAFYDREGHCRVPISFQTEDGYTLGQWVSNQRKARDKMSPERRAKLDELGFVWDEIEAKWTEGYEHLKAFHDREGHCRVPQLFRTEDGFRLGGWIAKQRETRDTMPPERRAKLDSLGFEWESREARWTEGYEHLRAFRDREGHCRVATRFRTEDGYRLGTWVNNQRNTRDTMPLKRRAKLDELGFLWDVREAAWTEGYEHLKAYRDREGHCRVPKGFQTEDGYSLASWVSNQRTARDTMPPERRAKLDELGFLWDVREAAWIEGYEHLKAYRDREGHCRVASRFRTEDGYTLGIWVRKQREARDTMPPERRAKLDELGFEWNLTKRKKTAS